MVTETTERKRADVKLMESAQILMLANGYHGTTVDDICKDAGVSKGSFYHFFSSKEELGLSALELYYSVGGARMMSGPFTEETDPRKKLDGFLKQTEENSLDFWGSGCLLGTFAIDLAETNPDIRSKVAELFENLGDTLSSLFAAVATEQMSAKELTDSYLTALEGSIVMAKSFNEPGRIRQALTLFRKQMEAGLP